MQVSYETPYNILDWNPMGCDVFCFKEGLKCGKPHNIDLYKKCDIKRNP